MSKPHRYRGLRPNPQALGVTPLLPGEVSRPVRVRASVEVHDWLRGFTSAELGQLLTQVYTQHQAQPDMPLEGHRKPRKARAGAGKGKSTGQEELNISAQAKQATQTTDNPPAPRLKPFRWEDVQIVRSSTEE